MQLLPSDHADKLANKGTAPIGTQEEMHAADVSISTTKYHRNLIETSIARQHGSRLPQFLTQLI